MKPFMPYFLIVAFCIVVQGFVLLGDGIYWDDWVWLEMPGANINWRNYTLMAKETGVLPINVAFMRLYDVVDFHLLVFLWIVVAAICVYWLCTRAGRLTRPAGMMTALISVSYPAYQTWPFFCTARYVHNYALFLVAAVLAVKAERWKGGRHWACRLAALGVFFLSFEMNSLLIYYFGFLFLLLSLVQAKNQLTFRQVCGRLLPSRLDYMLVPFVYWSVRRSFFAPSGLYAGYNSLELMPRAVLQSLEGFLSNAVYSPLNLTFRHMLSNPALWGGCLLIVLWWCRAFDMERLFVTERRRDLYSLIAFGSGLLLLAIAPYAAVGKFPALHGCDTRHAALIGLPMALLLVAGVGLAFTRRTGQLSCAGWAALIMLLLGFSRSTIANNIDWQARWIRDRSVMENLAKLEGAQKFSVYWVRDDFHDGARFNDFYEWSSMFKMVWGGEKRVGLDSSGRSQNFLTWGRPYFTNRYNLGEFDPNGPQAVLTIRCGRQRSNADLCVRYFYLKLLHPAKLESFLSWVTEVDVQPLTSPVGLAWPG